MVSAVNNEAYGNPAWGNTPPNGAPPWGNPNWQGPGWAGPPFWHPMGISRPLGIALMILGFVFFWPVGLVILFLMIWSGRMGCGARRRWAAWQRADGQGPTAPWNGWKCWGNSDRPAPTSGNRAFDEYRTETLRRLEEEQQEFGSFLERLRFAKDKAEFDAFMAERRQRPPAPPPEQPSQA